MYEGQLGQELEIFCLATDFNRRIACRGQHIRSGRDFLCESGTERPHKTGRRFIIESLSVADLGVYQCSTFGLENSVINTNFTITAGKSGAQVFEFIMSPNYGLVPCALCPLPFVLYPVPCASNCELNMKLGRAQYY